jgi:hypothetical protein
MAGLEIIFILFSLFFIFPINLKEYGIMDKRKITDVIHCCYSNFRCPPDLSTFRRYGHILDKPWPIWGDFFAQELLGDFLAQRSWAIF